MYDFLLVIFTNLLPILQTKRLGLHFCCRKFGNIFNHLYTVHPECYRFCWNNAK